MDLRVHHRKRRVLCLEMCQPALELAVRRNRKESVGGTLPVSRQKGCPPVRSVKSNPLKFLEASRLSYVFKYFENNTGCFATKKERGHSL